MLHVFVDADACPVKGEVYRVAKRNGLEVTLVANSWMRVPQEPWVKLQVVAEGPDAADDWILEHVGADDIVITADILLAGRCLQRRARVIGPTGKPFTHDNIGAAVATRDLLDGLRGAGEITSGPSPFQKRDRSRFLQQLEQTIQSLRRSVARARAPGAWGLLVVAVLVSGACRARNDPGPENPTGSGPAIAVSADSVGPITHSTPFDRRAIEAALPEYEIAEQTGMSEGEAFPVLAVRREDTTLLRIYPDPDGSGIFSVVVESPRIGNELGPVVGTSFREVYGDGPPRDCSPGSEELSGEVVCPSLSARNVVYVFSGDWAGPDGELPPPDALGGWRLSRIVWRPGSDGDGAIGRRSVHGA